MLAIVALLISVVAVSGEHSPRLWGSRIVGTPLGPSETMNYEYSGKTKTHIIRDFVWAELTIEYDRCVINGTRIWGKPCGKSEGYANITLNEVTSQKSMIMFENGEHPNVTATTFFVPRCKFPRPNRDEVDLATSFPFSRFVKDMPTFTIDFALGEASSGSKATLEVDGRPSCVWIGTKLEQNNASFCAAMVKDEKSNLRVFHGTFQRKTNVTRERFAFSGMTTVVVVSVDYSQSGISPEVAECNQYNEATTSTTSSGPAVMQTLGVIIGPLFMLLQW